MQAAPSSADYLLRLATEDDCPALEELIPLSARHLQAPYYTPAQIEAALGPVFAVDRQLIRDGTYFVIEHQAGIVACGGWSRRLAVFGGDAQRSEFAQAIDPARDPARIRAFFVHPAHARRGLGRMLLRACEEALQAAGFREAVMVATLAGEPLYTAEGYSVAERYDIPLRDDLTIGAVRMAKRFPATP
jgi:GNAT superfamily N-acetyltransferase